MASPAQLFGGLIAHNAIRTIQDSDPSEGEDASTILALEKAKKMVSHPLNHNQVQPQIGAEISPIDISELMAENDQIMAQQSPAPIRTEYINAPQIVSAPKEPDNQLLLPFDESNNRRTPQDIGMEQTEVMRSILAVLKKQNCLLVEIRDQFKQLNDVKTSTVTGGEPERFPKRTYNRKPKKSTRPFHDTAVV